MIKNEPNYSIWDNTDLSIVLKNLVVRFYLENGSYDANIFCSC